MPKIIINGDELEVENGLTIIQACEQAGVEIPRFCYHERLSIAGNCRMCLVEVEKMPKPVASCAMPVSEGMVVKTDTPLVKKAREGVMEFLLINHPLDCPICDQGGECDLQDQAMAYGTGMSRFAENKRAVKEKYMGPLIKTHMTRCIHCTRCIRFASEVAGVPEMGALGRGEHMEITTYLEKTLASELSANVIDLCPVGALTSKPYAFHARPWELEKFESIDVLDAVGSNIRVDVRGNEVMRILPRINEDVNEEWISDKTRYACDGLKLQRLDRPYVRRGGKLIEATWPEAFDAINEKLAGLRGDSVAAIAGDLVDCESITALKELMTAIGSPNLDCRQDGAKLDAKNRASYIFNTTIAGIEQADFCLIIGSNPRHEAPLINARLRKRYLRGGFRVASVGDELDITLPVQELGNDPKILEKIAAGSHEICAELKNAKNPMLIIGMGALARDDGDAVLEIAAKIAENCGMIREDWNGFNVLHTAASRVGALDLGFVPSKGGADTAKIIERCRTGDIEVLYLLGADEIDMSQLGNAFVIYQGHHGDAGAHRADVILPGAAYTEKDGTYVNTEGRVQRAVRTIFAPNMAKEDWRIIRALSERLGKTLQYDSIADVRARMEQINPVFKAQGVVRKEKWEGVSPAQTGLRQSPFRHAINNFYMTDVISRASRTMAECSSAVNSREKRKVA